MHQCVVFSILLCAISKVTALPHVKEPCLLLKTRGVYIPEGTSFTCECEELDPPVKDIYWESAKLGILTRVNASILNSTFLYLTLHARNDGDVITCWSSDGKRSYAVNFTTLVAYGPRSVNLTTSPDSIVLDNCPLCNATIRVTCLPLNFSPMGSIITIYKNGINVYNGTNTTTSLTVSSGGPIVVACHARNAVIPTNVSSSKTVEIREVPPTAPVMFVNGRNIEKNVLITEEHGNISIGCLINGGYPQVDNVTVQCGHLPARASSGRVAYYNLYVTRELNQTVCLCSGSHVTGAYNRTASLVLDVQYAASITSFTINNHTGSANISNNTKVQFSCQADGNPTPFVAITSATGNDLLQTGISPLNFTTSLPCDEGPTGYVCEANSSVGSPDTSVVNVTMLCMKEPQHLDLMPIIVGVVVAAVTVLIVISFLVFIIRYKKSRPSEPEPEPTACLSDNNSIIGTSGTHLSGNYNPLARGSQSTMNPYATFNNGTKIQEQAPDPPEGSGCQYIPTTHLVLDNTEDEHIYNNVIDTQIESNVEEPSVEIISRVPVVTDTTNVEEENLANSRKKPPILPQKMRRKLESSDSMRSDKSKYKIPCTSTRLAS